MKKLIFSLLLGATALGSSPLIAMDHPNFDQNAYSTRSQPPKVATNSALVEDTNLYFPPNKILYFKLNCRFLPFDSTTGQFDIRPALALNLGLFYPSGTDGTDGADESKREKFAKIFDSPEGQKKLAHIRITNDTNTLNDLINQNPCIVKYMNLLDCVMLPSDDATNSVAVLVEDTTSCFPPNKRFSCSLNFCNLPFLPTQDEKYDIRPALTLGDFFLGASQFATASSTEREIAAKYFDTHEGQNQLHYIKICVETNTLNTLLAQKPSLARYIGGIDLILQ